MDDDKILEITGNIEKALGNEAYATISDSIGELLTGNSENMKALAERDAEINRLKDRNEKLVTANGALLQKIPVGSKEVKKPKAEEATENKSISWNDIFDKNGSFIH